MSTKKYVYAGVQMTNPSSHHTYDDHGGVETTFSILVDEVTGKYKDPIGNPFSVGTINIYRINDTVLEQLGSCRERAIDETARAYEWGRFIIQPDDDSPTCWEKAYDDNLVLPLISDFICIDSAYIDVQFRSKRLFIHALVSISALIGFGSNSAMILLAQPWSHLGLTSNIKDPRYSKDLGSLVKYYESIGFSRLAQLDGSVAMSLSGMYNNKAWDKAWTRKLKTFSIKDLDKKNLVVIPQRKQST